MSSFLKNLNSTQIFMTSGFAIGFAHEFKLNKKTLEYPLSTIFVSSIGGIITLVGAALLHDFIPPNIRFILPVLATCSCIYYKYNDLKKSSFASKNKINKNTDNTTVNDEKKD